MKRSCDGSGAPASLQLRVQSRVLSLLRSVLVLLCLAALAGLFLFPQLSIPLGLGMLLAVPAGQAEQALAVLKEAGEAAYRVGEVVPGEGGVELVP